jgi:hypothetical protein
MTDDPNLTRNLERRRLAFGRTVDARAGTPTTRPPKIGGQTSYVAEVAIGRDLIRDNEVDADLDTIYAAHNALADTLAGAALPPPFGAGDVNKVLNVVAGPALAWTNTPHVNSITADNNVWITNGALAWSAAGISLHADNFGGGPVLVYTDGGGGHSWSSTAGVLMQLSGGTGASASLHLRPQGGDGLLGTEALEINGALIVKGATAAAPPSGTIQFAAGHFQGRIGAAWVNLDNDPPPAGSPFAEDATSIHPNTLTKPLYLGTTTTPTGTVNDLRLYAASAAQVTNGVTEIRVATTNPGTNQLAALHLVNGTQEDWLVAANSAAGFRSVGFWNWFGGGSPQQIFILNHQGTNTLVDNVQLNAAEFLGTTGTGAGYQSWLLHGKGDPQSVQAGASVTGVFDVRASQWVWPAGGIGISRRFTMSYVGAIARAAGQCGIKVLWGLASGPTTIFDWASGAVSWANANFYIDVDVWLYLGNAYYAVRMWLNTDPASQSAAATCTTFLSRGAVTGLQASSSPLMKLQGSFDTANAGNLVTNHANFLLMGLAR